MSDICLSCGPGERSPENLRLHRPVSRGAQGAKWEPKDGLTWCNAFAQARDGRPSVPCRWRWPTSRLR